MNGVRFLRSLRLTDLLSFGSGSSSVELEPLNVLIGPNGSGKSNIIEAVGLLQSAPRELAPPVSLGGGIKEWLWKGAETPTASIETVVDYPRGEMPIRYRLSFKEVGQRLEVADERIEDERPKSSAHSRPYFYFGYERGRPMLNVQGEHRALQREDLDANRSVLAQRQDPDLYPEVTYLGRAFSSIRCFREWNFGRYTAPRMPQPSDLPNEFLSEDARNLGLVLNRLRKDPRAKRDLLEHMRLLYERVQDVDVSIEGGTVQVFVQENGWAIPATRLSDGTLRWLCLLTILLHPNPPPLVCIEEPEMGLHPDLMPSLAKMLLIASARTQLIVATHSDGLVDALTETPEAVIVCEKLNGATKLRRLSKPELSTWLEKYTLGQLWRSGEIGGNRW